MIRKILSAAAAVCIAVSMTACGSIEEAETFAADCQARGFTTVSMKNDFATIYGENVRMNAPEETDEQAAA